MQWGDIDGGILETSRLLERSVSLAGESRIMEDGHLQWSRESLASKLGEILRICVCSAELSVVLRLSRSMKDCSSLIYGSDLSLICCDMSLMSVISQ